MPAGTGNDYGRGIGIPTDPLAAARLALTGQGHPVDVGEVYLDGRTQLFINVAGIGFDAEVARAVNAGPKWLGGTVPYLIGVLRTLGQYRPVNMKTVVDGKQTVRTVFLAAVAISRYYGGGMMIAPGAHVDDGVFDVCIAGNIGRAEALALVPKIYSGGHVGHPKVEFLRCQEIAFHPERSLAVHADGELLGDQPVRFRLLPRAIRVIR